MPRVTVLGIFVADLAFWSGRLPAMGETILGSDFRLGPGGKGSNQAIAARRAGAAVSLISRLGTDAFGRLARETYRAEGVDDSRIADDPDRGTGAAFILVQEGTGENAIIVTMGAAGALTEADVVAAESAIRGADVFATNCEVPVPVARRGLELARRHGVTTILNPAPAVPLPDDVFPLVDCPDAQRIGGGHAGRLSGRRTGRRRGRRGCAAGQGRRHGGGDAGRHRGAGGLRQCPPDRTGPRRRPRRRHHRRGRRVQRRLRRRPGRGAVAGRGRAFGCAVAGISVTRVGTAPSMPTREEVESHLAR